MEIHLKLMLLSNGRTVCFNFDRPITRSPALQLRSLKNLQSWNAMVKLLFFNSNFSMSNFGNTFPMFCESLSYCDRTSKYEQIEIYIFPTLIYKKGNLHFRLQYLQSL